MKGGDGEEEEDADAAAALPHAVAPVGAPSVYCCDGAEESKGGDREVEKDNDAGAALPHAVAPVGAPSVCGGAKERKECYGDAAACGGAEERKGCGGDAAATFAHAVAPMGAPSAAAAGLYGEWRCHSKLCCCTEKRRFRKDQVTRRDSVARRTSFDNLRLAAEQGFTPIIARIEFQNRGSVHEYALEFHPS